MNKKEKYSSSLKVGVLTLSAIFILIFTVLWVKGRSLSAGERIDLAFQDINGMRAGSGVQMMGLRIGQVEEITPVMQGKDSYVNLRFVVTEKGVKIPPASTITIQQSGIIGEQFLEITPPKTEVIYVDTQKTKIDFIEKLPVFMKLSEGEKEIGKIVDLEIMNKSQLPYKIRQHLKTKNILKVSYVVTLPGLILDSEMIGVKTVNDKYFFYLTDGEIPITPKESLKYTVIEPMRLADFMDLQFRAAKSLAETNNRVVEILSDEFIDSIKSSVSNIQTLTKNANTTVEKANKLIDSSKTEIDSLIVQSQELIDSLTKLSNNINEIVSDDNLKNDVISSIKSVGELSNNINKFVEDAQTQQMIADLADTMRNVNDISTYVNEYTKDEKLKEDLTKTITNLSSITENISKLMNDYNKLNEEDKMKLKNTVKDVNCITKNLKKFSEKLNKRFLLFRLMF